MAQSGGGSVGSRQIFIGCDSIPIKAEQQFRYLIFHDRYNKASEIIVILFTTEGSKFILSDQIYLNSVDQIQTPISLTTCCRIVMQSICVSSVGENYCLSGCLYFPEEDR